MLAAAVAVKVLVVASVKASEAFDFIFNGVRVYDVQLQVLARRIQV